MNNAQNARTDSYSWKQEDGKALLLKQNETLAQLQFNRYDTSLSLHGRELVIVYKGFWLPKLMIEEAGHPIATYENRFFGSKSFIKLQSGGTYTSEFKNTPLAALLIKDASGFEVLRYSLKAESGQPARMELMVSESQQQSDDLILLLILGFMATRSIMQENTGGEIDAMLVMGSAAV